VTGLTRWVGLTGALVLLAAVAPQLTASATVAPAASVTVTRFTPISVSPNRPLDIAGQLHVSSSQVLHDVTVTPLVSTSPITARSAVTDTLANPTNMTPLVSSSDRLGTVRPDTTHSYRLRIDTKTLPLGTMGVYPVQVAVTATMAGVSTTLASVTTLLPWYPTPSESARTRIVFVWPLVDTQHRTFSGVFGNDSLAASLQPGGRLNRLVVAATHRPVTWFIDPALLADASAMAAGYQVSPFGQPATTTSATPSATAHPGPTKGTQSSVAQAWLQRLNVATARRQIVSLPYGDLDVPSVIDAGHARLAAQATRWGANQARALLGRQVTSNIAWPVGGQLAGPTVDQLSRAGDSAVLLSSDAVPPTVVPAYTPSGRAVVGTDQVDALLSDPTLDQLVAASPAGGAVLARQRFLGETLLITAELPSAPRLVVVAPPRRWNPSPQWAHDLMTALSEAPWLRPVSVDQALRWPIPALNREPLPSEAPPGQLPSSAVDAAARSMNQLRTFGGILSDPNPTVSNYRAALYSGLSTQWRVDPTAEMSNLAATSAALNAQRGQVRIVSRGGTLTSTSGPLPLTVVNGLGQDVNLGLNVQSSDPLRLQIDAPQRLSVPSGARVSVDAQVTASTSGNLAATAQLVTPHTRRPYSEPVVLDVRVRAYGEVAFLVFGGAAILLIAAVAIRLAKRIARSRRHTSEGAGG